MADLGFTLAQLTIKETKGAKNRYIIIVSLHTASSDIQGLHKSFGGML